jgi:hypothetical protein
MGKADRQRNQSARERIAAQQAAAKRAEAQRRMLVAGGAVAAVLIVVIVLIVIKSLAKPPAPSAASTAPASTTTTTTVAKAVSDIPASVFNAVGAGANGVVSPLTPVSGPVLTSAGKPEMLYVGAEYCPYCAAERWAMAAALSRFGTFSGLHLIRSNSTDVYGNTATLSFYKSSYSSKYVAFTPVETTTVAKAALQNPTSAQDALMNKYDAPPYVPSGDNGSFPFVDIGNAYITDGAQYLPSVLGSVVSANDPSHFGLTWNQIAADLQHPSSPVAQAIIGSANHITAAICKLTNGQPGSVCSSRAVTSVASKI